MPARPARILAVCGLSGAALPLAFAPFFLWWLAPLCYAVLFLAWQGATPRQAFARGWVFGASQFLFGIYWVVISLHGFGGAPLWLAVVLMLCLVGFMALYPAAVGWVSARWFRNHGRWYWLGALPAALVLAEWVRGWLLTGFGWLSPGYAQTESWLIGLAPVFGLLGVSWAVLLIAGALAMAISGRQRERVAAGVIIVALFVAGFALERIDWTERKPEDISIALAQGAVPQDRKWLPEELPGQMNLYRALTVESLGADLIIWPEAAIPDYYERFSAWLASIEQLAANAGSRVMLGMLSYSEAGPRNALFTLGQPESTYTKRHLVPYGEFFPMPDFVRPWIESMNLAYPNTQPGDPGQPPVEIVGEKIAVTICYEDVFGAEQLHSFPDATLIVNISNDGWFGNSIAPHQHLQIARMRSAEVRRFTLRSTNTGVTAVIDPRGRISAELPQFESGVLRATAAGMTGRTPYIVWGDLAVLLLAAAVLVAYWLTTKLTMRPGT